MTQCRPWNTAKIANKCSLFSQNASMVAIYHYSFYLLF